MHHPFLQANGDSLKRRVQSPRRRDFKDFSTPRDFRSPNRFNGNESAFLLPGYALSPDEDEDSGADSLNEHFSKDSEYISITLEYKCVSFSGSVNGSQHFGHCSVAGCMHCYQNGNQGQSSGQAIVPYNGHGCCNGSQYDCWSRPHQRASMPYNSCYHRPLSPSSCMAVQPAYLDEKMKELENDKESLRLQVSLQNSTGCRLSPKNHNKA